MAGSALTMPLVRPSGSRSATSSRRLPSTRTDASLRLRLYPRLRLIALFAGSVLVGTVACAQDRGSGQPNSGATAQADQNVEVLLRQIGQQITIGHTMAPEGDNALVTWHRLLELVSPTSPATEKALANFVSYARRRATEEQAAGRPVIASDLSVFADQTAELLQRRSTESTEAPKAVAPATAPAPVPDMPPSSAPTVVVTQGASPSEASNVPTQRPAPMDSRRGETEQGRGQMTSPDAVASARSSTPGKEAMTTAPSAGNTGAASALLAPLPAATMRHTQEQSGVAAVANRGDAMLAIKDITAARGYYEYAAKAGSARAAMALAETYDPAYLNQWGVLGTKPDPEVAVGWYRKAAALGERGADVRLRMLEATR
jgi:hypothetical protein